MHISLGIRFGSLLGRGELGLRGVGVGGGIRMFKSPLGNNSIPTHLWSLEFQSTQGVLRAEY